MKTVFLNGRFVPETEATVSVFDRGFLYGDGIFETLLICRGKPFLWKQHWERLEQGAAFLRLQLPMNSTGAYSAIEELLRRNSMSEGVLRLTVSRGTGTRGYSIRNATSPLVVMTLHDAPETGDSPVRWRLRTASFRVLKNDPLARIKSANKLLHVLAKTEAEQGGYDEALLLNSDGEIAEATSGNIFWVEGNQVFTPPLDAGILPGVTRSVVFDLCREAGIVCLERSADLSVLQRADAIFLTLSTLGIVEAVQLNETTPKGSGVVSRLFCLYRQVLAGNQS